jgi:hypothetical protein
MSTVARLGVPVLLTSLFLPLASFAQSAPAPAAAPAAGAMLKAPPSDEWLTWGYNGERSNWNHGETRLNKTNVSHLKVLWDTQVSTPITDIVLSTLTAPLVVKDVDVAGAKTNLVLLLGADDTVFALNADNGKVVWQKTFPNPLKPQREANWLCPNTANATPTIDKARGLVFFTASDGKLRALSLSDGAEKMPPTDMVSPFARSWSLNLIKGVVYTDEGRGCGGIYDPHSAMAAAATAEPGRSGPLPDPASVTAVDVHDLDHPQLTRFYLSGGRPAGGWGQGGVVRTDRGILVQTADGIPDPAAGTFGSSVVELAPKATRVLDTFTPANWKYINLKDLDPGSGSPLVFPFGNRAVALSVGKEAVAYLLDTASLGGADHATPLYKSPQLGNDAAIGTEPGQGLWGAPGAYQRTRRRSRTPRAPRPTAASWPSRWSTPAAASPPWFRNGPRQI